MSCAGPAVSHRKAGVPWDAVLSQQSTLRRGLCLDPSGRQTPSHLTEAATSRRSRAAACLSLFAEPKKTQTTKHLAGKRCRLAQERGVRATRCCAAGFGCGFLRGANAWLQEGVLPRGRLDGLLQPPLWSCLMLSLSLPCFRENGAVKLHS